MQKKRHTIVFEMVETLYKTSPNKFAQWMWEFHVSIVAKWCQKLLKKYGGDHDIVMASAWLHDVADVLIERNNPQHEIVSLQKTREILGVANYSPQEIALLVQEVLMPHSCYSGNYPKVIEGKILATADALAHITTDFYLQFCWMHIPSGKTYQEFKLWVGEKIERDYNAKIFFEEEKKSVKEKYKSIRQVFVE